MSRYRCQRSICYDALRWWRRLWWLSSAVVCPPANVCPSSYLSSTCPLPSPVSFYSKPGSFFSRFCPPPPICPPPPPPIMCPPPPPPITCSCGMQRPMYYPMSYPQYGGGCGGGGPPPMPMIPAQVTCFSKNSEKSYRTTVVVVATLLAATGVEPERQQELKLLILHVIMKIYENLLPR